MKKTLRLTTLLLALLLLCTVTTGCQALDDLRAHHGKRDGDTIVLNGTQYQRLPSNPYFNPLHNKIDIITVTEKDVPVLLSTFVASSEFYALDDGAYIVDNGDTYYCPKENYQKLKASLEADFKPTGYCYEYVTYDKKNYKATTHLYSLTEEQIKAISEVISTTTPSDLYSIDQRYDYLSLSVDACTEDKLLRCEVLVVYLLEDGNYVLVDGPTAYVVPQQYKAIMTDMTAKRVESAKVEKELFADTEEILYEDSSPDFTVF